MTQNIALVFLLILTTGFFYTYRKLRSIRHMNKRMQIQISEHFTGQKDEVSATLPTEISNIPRDHFAGEILNDYRLNEMLRTDDMSA